MALLAPCGRRDRPDRRPARTAADQHDRAVAFAQESIAERAARLDAVAGPDGGADLGRHQPARIAADVKDQLGRSGRTIGAHRRAELARREAGELDAEIL